MLVRVCVHDIVFELKFANFVLELKHSITNLQVASLHHSYAFAFRTS